MPQANDLPSASLGLATGLCLIAVYLFLRQWYEQQARDRSLAETDRTYYRRQDLRRWFGVGVLLIIAFLVLIAARLVVRPDEKSRLAFVWLWLVILGLIGVLLLLAFIDLIATSRYAKQHQKKLLHESIASLKNQPSAKKASDPHLPGPPPAAEPNEPAK
jgi:hypothetical protein